MPQPSILAVVRAVKSVAPAHPAIVAWWYTPPQRLRLAGELSRPDPSAAFIEVVVQCEAAAAVSRLQIEPIEKALSAALPGAPVRVRAHRGAREERALFRLLSTTTDRGSGESPCPA